MGPSALGASGALWRPLLALGLLLLAARPGARAQATIDNNFGALYGVGPATEYCLDKASSDCSGSTGPELNSCLCRRDRFALESARCIARVSPGDLDDVYFQMRANCLETGGFTLVVDQAAWVSAAEAATATTTSSTTTSSPEPSTAPPARTTADSTATPTTADAAPTARPPTDTGRATMAAPSTPSATAAAAAAAGLDTGVKIGVGVGVAVGAILLTAGVVIWLKWRRRQRAGPRYADRDAHIMEASDMVRTYPPPQAGPGEGPMGAGMYHKPPVGTASSSASPLGQPSPELRGGAGGGHWMPAAQPFHPHQQQYTYPDHPSIAELGDGSDVTSHALSARNSARYSELPGGQSPLYPPPSSPSPVSPGPNTSPPLHSSHGGGPQPGAQG